MNQDDINSECEYLCLDFDQQEEIHRWRRLTDCDEFVGVGRTKHTIVAYQNSIYVFGGINGKVMLNDLLRFDTNEMSWSRPPNSYPPSSRYHHSAVVHNKSMFIFGGYTGGGGQAIQLANCNDLYEYRFSMSAWNKWKIEGLKPVPRCGHGCAIYNNHLWIFAGYDGKLRLNDMWRLSLDRTPSIWEEVEQYGEGPPTCCNFALTVARDSMYVFSGQSGAMMGNELFRFHFDSKRWHRFMLGEYVLKNAPPPPSKRYGHTMVSFGRHLYVFGGGTSDSTVPSMLHAFDLDDETWSLVEASTNSQVPSYRLFHAATVIKDSMYIFGGTIEAKVRSNELFQFRFSNFPVCTLRHDFAQLLESKALFDIEFHLNPGHSQAKVIIPAHIAIVSARSKVFESKIDLLFADRNKSSKDTPLKLDLEDIDTKAFRLVLFYIYTDRIDPAKVEVEPTDGRAMVLLMTDVYSLAVRLQLVRLENMCKLYFHTSINLSNVLTAMVNAHNRSLNLIKNICMKCILKDSNYTQLVMSTEFERIPQSLMIEIIRRQVAHVCRQNATTSDSSSLAASMRFYDLPDSDHSISLVESRADQPEDIDGQSLSEDMRIFLERAKFCDIYLLAENDTKVSAHRAILAARSGYFCLLFRSYPPVSNEVAVRIGDSVVPSVSAFESLLRYIYNGRTDMPPEHALYLHSASAYFDFTNNRLMMFCKRNLESNINEQNIIEILAISDKLHLTEIKQHAFNLIAQNINLVGKQKQLDTLNKNLLVEIIQNTAKQYSNIGRFIEKK